MGIHTYICLVLKYSYWRVWHGHVDIFLVHFRSIDAYYHHTIFTTPVIVKGVSLVIIAEMIEILVSSTFKRMDI